LLKQSKKRDYYKILGVKRYDIITFIAKWKGLYISLFSVLKDKLAVPW
jgi:hypothetical protein